jgi:hypothetical protein
VLIEPVQIRLLTLSEHFPPNGEAHPATHHPMHQIEFVFVATPIIVHLADVNYICYGNSTPEHCVV